MKRWLVGGALILVLAVVTIASLKGTGGGEPVQVEPAKKQTVVRTVQASGKVEPARKVEISTKVGGEVVRLPVHEGDAVQPGDLLVQIEQEAYRAARDEARAALAQARSAVAQAEVRLEDARRVLKRTEGLQAKNHVSEEALEQARLTVRLAEADLQAARHRVSQMRFAVERAEEDLARTTIRSPMAGEVIRLDVEQGETVVPGTMNMPGSVLLVVADLSTLLAEVEVNEVDVVEVEPGQQVDVQVEALGDTVLPGEVREIAASGVEDAALKVVRFPVKVAVLENDPRLRPGMTAKVDIHTARHEDVVTVPIQAVVKRKVTEEDLAHRRAAAGGPATEEAASDRAVGEVAAVEGDGGADEAGSRSETVVPRARPSANGRGAAEQEVVFVAEDGVARLRPVRTGIADALVVEITEGLEADAPVVVGPYRSLKSLQAGDPIDPKDGEVQDAKAKANGEGEA